MDIYLPYDNLRQSAAVTQPLVHQQLGTLCLLLGMRFMDDTPLPRHLEHLHPWLGGHFDRFLYEYAQQLCRVYQQKHGVSHPMQAEIRRSYRHNLLERLVLPSDWGHERFLRRQRGRLLHEGDKLALARRIRNYLGPHSSLLDWVYHESGADSWLSLSTTVVEYLNRLLDLEGVRRYDNWFDSYDWGVPRSHNSVDPALSALEFCVSRQGEDRIYRR